MKLIKSNNIKIIPTETNKTREMIEENIGYITEFFTETIKRYKEKEILNFIMIIEDVPGDHKDIEVYGITHSGGRHLQGLMEDAAIIVRRREWGEEEDEE